MKKRSVYFTDQQFDLLEAQAAHVGISFAEQLRRALDEWGVLRKSDEKRPNPTAPRRKGGTAAGQGPRPGRAEGDAC